MQVVPVIDLKEGQVVHAVRGDRARYRPVESVLCRGSDPLALADRLCEHCATDTIYVADIDALQGEAPQTSVLARLLAARPGLRVWLDAGFENAGHAESLRRTLGSAAARVTPVFGSETLRGDDAMAECFRPRSEALLSLDRRAGAVLDAAGAWRRPAQWPRRVIVMSLDRVGTSEGPDLELLAGVRSLAPNAQWIGAGGIRDEADLRAAAAAGASAWLVATALHDGRLAARPRATDCVGPHLDDHTVWQAASSSQTAPSIERVAANRRSHAESRVSHNGIGFASE